MYAYLYILFLGLLLLLFGLIFKSLGSFKDVLGLTTRFFLVVELDRALKLAELSFVLFVMV